METKQSNNSATPMADAVKIANQRALFSLEWENDTVFKKRELNYKTKAAFQKDLEAGKISKYTTVFIKDSKEIYKNGQYYGSSDGSGVSGNFAECMLVNYEISEEIFSNLKPPFGTQTTFTPSEGLKNLLINNAKNISSIAFDYKGENISFGANVTEYTQTTIILTINIHTFPLLLGFGNPLALIYIQLDIASNSVTITAFPVPYLNSKSTGDLFFCDDGQFKKTGFDEISLSPDIINGTISSGNFTEEEYNKILVASEKGFIIVNSNGLKLLANVSKDASSESKNQLILCIGQIIGFIGVMSLANSIIIKDKSENYAFISDISTTCIYGEDGLIKIYMSPEANKEEEINLIINGDGSKFLSDDGQYKTIETISPAVGKIDSNSDGAGEIFNNYDGEDLNISKGNSSHAEGKKTQANSNGSHAEGIETIAGDSSDPKNGKGAHAEGQVTTALGNGSHAEGYSTKALKDRSHAEGYGTKADNQQAHAEGYYTTATGINSHIEGKSTIQAPEDITEATDIDSIIEKWNKSTSVHDNKFSLSHGQFSHGEGYDILALGNYSHAEGSLNIAKGECSHAEGFFNEASGMNSHAEGDQNQASGANAHAEGSKNVASNENSHAEGQGTIASGKYSHAEGIKTQAIGNGSHAEGDNCIAEGVNSHVEGRQNCAVGEYSHAEGSGAVKVNKSFYTKTDSEIIAEWVRLFQTPTKYDKGDGFSMAKGKGSHCEGKNTLALGDYSHAGGNASIARGKGSFSHGYIDDTANDGSGRVLLGYIKANGYGSWAGGFSVNSKNGVSSNGEASFAFGYANGSSIIADGVGSVAIGAVDNGNMSSIAFGSVALNCGTIANNYGQTSIGSYNSSDSASSSNSLNVTKIAFAIGNGSNKNSRGNAFKVLFSGQTYADGAYSGSGADYAEFFEWKDGNELNEDRVGLFVSIENDKIIKATKDSKYILGIVSGNPSVIGDNPMRWKNKYLTDKFGRPIYEEVEVKKYEKKINDNGEEEVVETIEKQKTFKTNPEWDSSKEYISRESRKEWSAIGLMGKLIVRHDGTLKQGGFCYPSKNGIATNSETGYYVMKVYEDTALIMFK